MARGTNTLISTIIGPGRVMQNIAPAIFCYPLMSDDSDGLTVTSGSSNFIFGDWVQFIGGAAATLVASDFAVLGGTFQSDFDSGSHEAVDLGAIQIGIGAAGSQEAVETIYLGKSYYEDSKVCYQTVYLPIPRYIPASSEVWVRWADDTVARSGYVKLVYCRHLRRGGQFLNNHHYQNKFNSALCSSTSSGYVPGAWVDIIPADTIKVDSYIRGVHLETRQRNYQYIVQIGVGNALLVNPVAELPYATNYWRDGSDDDPIVKYIPLPIMLKIDANDRVAARVAEGLGRTDEFYITLDIVKGTFFT